MKKIIVAAVIGAVSAAFAEGEATFGGWRLSVGGNMAFGAKVKMNYSRETYGMAVPGGTFNPADLGRGKYEFDNGAYIDTSYMQTVPGGINITRDWRIPASMTSTAGTGDDFQRTLNFSNTELAGGNLADDGIPLGASLELARTVYASSEKGFGVDLAIGVAWMMCNNILNSTSQGRYNRMTSSWSPVIEDSVGTVENFPTYKGAWYGGGVDQGRSGQGDMYFHQDWAQNPSEGPCSVHASGDYDEFEFALMLRPWYEPTDWWRLYGTIGMGLGCGMFDFTMNAAVDDVTIRRMSEDECEWDFYGIAGGGTVFRLGSFDLSLDILYRFGQDDINVGNQYVNCTIEKPDLVLRLAIGYEF